MRRDPVNTSYNRIIILLALNQTELVIQKIWRKDFLRPLVSKFEFWDQSQKAKLGINLCLLVYRDWVWLIIEV